MEPMCLVDKSHQLLFYYSRLVATPNVSKFVSFVLISINNNRINTTTDTTIIISHLSHHHHHELRITCSPSSSATLTIIDTTIIISHLSRHH
jgi:hypothetical protein